MANESRDLYGPLSGLGGIWEGTKGTDRAPDDNPLETEVNAYREQIRFEDIGLVENHEQKLYGFRYGTTAWRVDESDAFHEEVGYWLYEPASQQTMRCFSVPRGVTLLAGGTVAADAASFELAAEAGSETYGILSNPFLIGAFKVVRYDLKFERPDHDTIRYWEDTVLKIPGAAELFHHTDENTLSRKR